MICDRDELWRGGGTLHQGETEILTVDGDRWAAVACYLYRERKWTVTVEVRTSSLRWKNDVI